MPRIRWILIAVSALLLFLITGTILFFEVEWIAKLTHLSAEMDEKLAEIEKNINLYGEQIDFFSTDEGIAYLGRDQYNFVYPGEQIFVIQEVSSGDY